MSVAQSTNPTLIRAKEVCELCGGISTQTLARWIKSPKVGLPPLRKINGCHYWLRDEIEAFLRPKEATKGSVPDMSRRVMTS